MDQRLMLGALAGVLSVGAAAHAGFVGFSGDLYGADGYAVFDVYAQFDSTDDVLLDVFDATIYFSDGSPFVHDDPIGGGSWNPAEVSASSIDSFVTIGGFGEAGSNTWTAPDGGWGSDGFDQAGVPFGSGWTNLDPANGAGQAQDLGDGIIGAWIGRFVLELPSSPISLEVSASVSFNQGIGTPVEQGMSAISIPLPGPGGIAAFTGLMTLPARRRRGAGDAVQPRRRASRAATDRPVDPYTTH